MAKKTPQGLHIVALVVGVALVAWGFNEYGAFGNELARAFSGKTSDKVLLLWIAGGALSLSVLPTFATRWLAPRLGRFLEQNPGISFNLSTKIQRFSFASETFDAAIYFGEPDWPGARHLKLFDETLTACASPGFLAQNPIAAPSDMAGLPLLQLETRPTGWADWFAAHGVADQAASGMVMDQFSMMIQAAISGLGIALLPHYLARPEIEENRLHPVLNQAVPATGAYWLAWPEEKDGYAPLARFREWIAMQNAHEGSD